MRKYAAVRVIVVIACLVSAAGCSGRRATLPQLTTTEPTLTLSGQFSIPSGERYPAVTGLPFGGISGLVAIPHGSQEMFGVSDAQRGGRIYRFAIQNGGSTFRVSVVSVVFVEAPPGDTNPADFEGLGVLPNGNFLIASEGSSREPRRPPSIAQYGQHGEFVGELPVRERYAPEVTGALTKGARGNAGFESLAMAPDGRSFFTGLETALVQDGEPATFDRGTRSRLVEYRLRHGRFEPAREFAYDLDALERPTFAPGFFINGLVELLWIDSTTLLSLERGYVESSADPSTGMNYIRVYRISLRGATDISSLESVRNRPDVVPVQKSLLLDLTKTPGLDSDLAPSMDNFEGMAFGPRLPDGRQTLLLVSDDNFSNRQRTWFLEFAIGSGAR